MKKNIAPKIVFIGAGNLATSLSEALKGKWNILQVYSKTLANAQTLGKKLSCPYTNDLGKISPGAGLYIIAVKDGAIEEVCKKLKLKDAIVVHTSGSTDMNSLKKVSSKYGVVWPMYSFAGKAKLAPGASCFIEASDKKTEKTLIDFVKELNGKPHYLNSEKRAMVHMAAVFVNNFPNHLFAIAEKICKEAGVPFSLFLPLARETEENIAKQSPIYSQTGPAVRNEKRILSKHLSLLTGHPIYKEVYEVLTKSIIQTKNAGEKKL